MNKTCKNCGKPISENSVSGLCRSCAQKKAAIKRKQIFMDKYGVDNPSKLPEVIDKITNTFQSRYGVKRAMSVPAFRKKFEDTMQRKYGVSYYTLTEEYRKNDHFRISKIAEWWSNLLTAHNIKHSLEYAIDTKCYDICIPEQKILLEIDPSYTHNELGNHWNSKGLDKKYHLNKSLLAKENGFRCIHVFDWDSPDRILNLVLPKDRIYARDCKVSEVSVEKTNKFLNLHHIQGTCAGQKIRLGLYNSDGELMQLITFGTPRYAKKFDWELLRLCTVTGKIVVGGASKLFKHAVEQYSLSNIISYCDFAKFNGNVYEQIGMTFYKLSEPNRIWSKEDEYVTANLLRQHGYDRLFNTNYGKGTSNDQLMIDNGWLPVMDCGQLQYTYKAGQSCNAEETQDVDLPIFPKAKKGHEPRICAFCGKEFIPASSHQRYCKGPHIRQCPICGKDYVEDNVENLKRPPVACSYECRAKKTRQTSLQKYGTLAPGNNPEAREKAKATMQSKFGVDYAMQSETLKQKSQDALYDKYGVRNIKHAKTAMPLFRLSSQMKNEVQLLDILQRLCRYEEIDRVRLQEVSSCYPKMIPDSKGILKTETSAALVLEKSKVNASQDGIQMQQAFIESYPNGIILYPYDKVTKLNLLNPKVVQQDEVKIFQLNYKTGADWIQEHYVLDKFADRRLLVGLVRKNEIIEVASFSTTFQDNVPNPTMIEYFQLPGFKVVNGLSMIIDWIQSIYAIPALYATIDKSLGQHESLTATGFEKIRDNPPKVFWMKDGCVERNSKKLDYQTVQHKLECDFIPVPDCGQAVYVLK